ncbi:hypothetical protein CISG_08229 [Coccidioides immitis RMSCC 3703]|uniref:AB hydrolase-1 domain-containing protein n=1 Tax=Coccidioides immitis RMSCC 3703 TaxID=454286 RepID=A0A0J8U0W3_COCIT|nr:hypothetical protein CISG_08229 [Coccidioides immitis RMSCC 3703]
MALALPGLFCSSHGATVDALDSGKSADFCDVQNSGRGLRNTDTQPEYRPKWTARKLSSSSHLVEAVASLTTTTPSQQVNGSIRQDPRQSNPLAPRRPHPRIRRVRLPIGLPAPLLPWLPFDAPRGLGPSVTSPHRRNLRIIHPRPPPDSASSTFYPGRRITDWPADVHALTQHLRLSRFAVLGGSGGSPYALASLAAVGLLAGAPPWIAGTQGVSLSRRIASSAATHWPSGLLALTDMLVGMLRWVVTTGPVERALDTWLQQQNAKTDGAEAGSSSIKEDRERVLQLGFEAFAQGAGGFVQETRLLTHDWGFRFEDIRYDKIQIWHGAKDVNSPVRMTRYMAERLPHCVLREFEGDDHYTMVRHLEQIVSEFVPEEMTSEYNGKTS